MPTFALIPGAGGVAWYWHRIVPLLEAAGHHALAIDLPGDDERAGLATYTDLVVDAIGQRGDVVVVAQSLGGFVAPLVCARVRVRALGFVNAMIPKPHETAGEWWDNTSSGEARKEAARRGGYREDFDIATYFLHDVPATIAKAGEPLQRPQSDVVFGEPCDFDAWPDVPIHVIAGRDDRFFPLEFQRRVARERLGLDVEVVAGGHLVALSNPQELADRLQRYG